MYPRKIDTGNATQNVNLSLNWAVPSDPKAARTACMANPDDFNFTVDITHQHSMVLVTCTPFGLGLLWNNYRQPVCASICQSISTQPFTLRHGWNST